MTHIIKSGLILAGIFFTQLLPVHALQSGEAARLEFGQADMLQAYNNAITGAGAYNLTAVAIGGGRMYAADTNNNRVLWWNTSTPFGLGRAADGVIGQTDLISALPNMGVGAGATTLSAPSGVAVDPAGNVWVSDTGNHRVIRFPVPAANGATADLLLGQAAFTDSVVNRGAGAGSPAGNTFDTPQGIWIDGVDLWVADSGNNRVLKFSGPIANDDLAALVVGQGAAGNSFTTALANTSSTELSYPSGVSVDASSNVWVADSGNNRVVRFPLPSQTTANLVLGQNLDTDSSVNMGAGLTAAAASMWAPQSVTAHLTKVWVADSGNNRIMQWTSPSINGEASAFVLGQSTTNANLANRGGNAAASATLSNPMAVAILGTDLWAADAGNNRLVRYNNPNQSGAAANAVAGQKDFAQNAVNTPAAQSLYGPAGLAVNAAGGRIYVVDANNNRVLWWNSSAAFVNRQAADGVLGQPDFTSVLANRGAAVPASNTLNGPSGAAVDAAGDLWVLDAGNSRALRYTAPSANGQAAAAVLGQGDFVTGTLLVAAAGTFSNPTGVWVDGAGKLWIADAGNNRVLRFSSFALNAAADLVLGQGGSFTTFAAGVTNQAFTNPMGVSVDASSNVWVSDSGNNRVLKFPSAAATASLVIGQGAVGNTFGANAAGVSATALTNPTGANMDAQGGLWVTDSGNSRILRFTSPAASAVTADLTLGQANLTSGSPNRANASPDATTLNLPSFAVASANRIWISDAQNNRALKSGPLYGTDLGLSFTGASSSTLSAAWPALAAGSYTVVLSTDSGFGAFASSTTESVNTKTFTGLNSSTAYYLEVKLSTEAAAGFTANFASTVTLPSVTTLAPSMTAPAVGSLTASWTAIAGSNFIAVLASDPAYATIVSSGLVTGTSTATYNGLTNYSTYYFEVKLSTEADAAYAINQVSTMTLAGAVSIASITPDSGLQGASDINLTMIGTGFAVGAAVKLTRTGQTDVAGVNVTVVSATRITFTVHQPLAAGQWNVSVNSAGQSAALANAFTLMGTVPNSAKVYEGIFKPKLGGAAQLTTSLLSGGQVNITVYDILGRKIREIYVGSRPAGNYLDVWDGRNDNGSLAASGVYLIRFKCPGFSMTKRVVLVK